MSEGGPARIPIQHVLSNICDELIGLSERLQQFEEIIFGELTGDFHETHVHELQDLDLIIQQISDLARAIRCVAEVELDDAMVGTTVLGDRLHLNDLRQRLLGLQNVSAPKDKTQQDDILLF